MWNSVQQFALVIGDKNYGLVGNELFMESLLNFHELQESDWNA